MPTRPRWPAERRSAGGFPLTPPPWALLSAPFRQPGRANTRRLRYGQVEHHPDQARQQRRDRLLLRDQEERPEHHRQARDEQVRPGRAQARRLPRSEDQVRPAAQRRRNACRRLEADGATRPLFACPGKVGGQGIPAPTLSRPPTLYRPLQGSGFAARQMPTQRNRSGARGEYLLPDLVFLFSRYSPDAAQVSTAESGGAARKSS